MAKVYILCGKICSGKSYYSKKLQKETNAVILSPDEATYQLLQNEQGPFYDVFSKRLIEYLNKKCVEIVHAGANVIYEKGCWSKRDRIEIKEFFKQNNIPCEIHYVHVDDVTWEKQIEERNKRCLAGNGGADFYIDEGLKNKIISLFEVPTRDEVDVWYERTK